MIKLQVIGNLGRDCALNNVNGKSVINFSVAHTEKFRDAQGVQKDKTVWVECAYWTDRTGIAPYLKKGQQVYAEGIPDIRNYTTKEGTPGTSLTLRVTMVQLLGGRGDNQGSEAVGNTSYQNTQPSYNQQSYNQPAYNQPAYSQAGSNSVQPSEITEPLDDLPF